MDNIIPPTSRQGTTEKVLVYTDISAVDAEKLDIITKGSKVPKGILLANLVTQLLLPPPDLNHNQPSKKKQSNAAHLRRHSLSRPSRGKNVKPLNKCKAHSSTVIPCTAACADNRENSSSVKPQHTSCFSRSARAAKEISFSCARGTSAPGTFSHL